LSRTISPKTDAAFQTHKNRVNKDQIICPGQSPRWNDDHAASVIMGFVATHDVASFDVVKSGKASFSRPGFL
jgi:hypothetical protein